MLRQTFPYVSLCLVFWASSIIFARFSLAAPFAPDDLHLVRTYSSAELRGVWWDTWDPDRLETGGFRPLTTIFNHFRARLLGESPVAHRVFLLGLFSLFLTLAVFLARFVFEIPYAQGLLAGLFAFLHKGNAYHYLWISDGVHLVSGILILSSVAMFLLSIRHRNYLLSLAALLLSSAALLTREDSLIVYPLLFIFGGAFILINRCLTKSPSPLPIVVFTFIASTLILLSFWTWRTVVVPDARAPRFDVADFIWSVKQTVENLGDSAQLTVWSKYYVYLIWLATVCLGTVLGAFLFGIGRQARLQAMFWGSAIVIGALPGLTYPRLNLLLLPITFWGLFTATVLGGLAARSSLGCLGAAALSVVLLSLSAFGSISLQREYVPANLDWICEHTDWIYGDRSGASIPQPRRELVTAQLNQYGIYSLSGLRNQLPQLVADAQNGGRFGPDAGSGPFVPRWKFLPPGSWRMWSCAGTRITFIEER